HVRPRALVHHVEAHHEHFPDGILQRALERLVGEIDDWILGETDVPDLALAFLLDQLRSEHVARMVVHVGLNAVQIEHVDVVGTEQPQRIVEARHHPLGRPPLAVALDGRFGGEDDGLAPDSLERLADHAFCAVGRRGIDEVDAKLDGVAHEPRRLLLIQAGFQPHAGKAAGAEPGDADAQAGFAESGVLHCVLYAACSIRSTWIASNGKTIRPLSVFCRIPALSKACTSPWTALTSRPTRRAAARIVIGPAPAIERINSQRFAVINLNRTSGDAKLMRAPCLLPLKASRARRFTSSSEASCNVTVFISSPPKPRRPARSPPVMN